MTAEPVASPQPFKAVPIASLPPETVSDTAPKRRGRKPRDPNAPPAQRRARSMETQIGAALMTFNLPLWAFPQTRDDALDEAEITALAKALDAQAQSSPRFRKYLKAALDATSGGQLLTVLMVIGARRMARHNFILPPEADAGLGRMLGSVDQYVPSAPEPGDEPPNVADDAARE